MKFTKKLSVLLILISVSLCAYAQNNKEYQKHLEKGKEYESQKKWVHALGEYWDALEAQQDGNTNTVTNFILALKDTIENGNPGYGTYGEFEYYDEWINLMIDYENYWTEHCPYYFTYSFNKTGINREERTAKYYINQEIKITPRCEFITLIFYHGLENAKKDFWDEDLIKYWPNISAYNFVKGKKGNLIDGTALITNSFFSQYMMPAAFATLRPDSKQNSFLNFVNSYFSGGDKVEAIRYALNCFLSYKISFALKNLETGEVIYTSNPTVIFSEWDRNSWSFQPTKLLKPELEIVVGQNFIPLVENNKIVVVVNSIELMYGTISKEFTWDNIKIDLNGKWADGLSTKNVILDNKPIDFFSEITEALENKKRIDNSIDYYKNAYYESIKNKKYDEALANIDKWYEEVTFLLNWNKINGTEEDIKTSENELNEISAIKENTNKAASKSKFKKGVQSFLSF